MTKIIYATQTGNTENIANQIAQKIGENVDVVDIANATKDDFEEADFLIMGTSTWGEGELPDELEGAMPLIESLDLKNKNIALFGLGDQEEYGEYFVNALGILYEKLKNKGANIVGFTSTDGYEYDESKAEIEPGVFCGLVLDEDNQDDLTEQRVDRWLEEIKPYIK
ncbi:flavodoxin I [Nitratiruptor sp. YY08-26]|uniref:flavodoxin n=1 Tax=unclassified Nitratiruptor TaxID=2624044 RepID=UPI001915796E|nr:MULTISPECIES: flavodoxin [unclassified Nitratiruptor]BCD61650.1 flavodoxin I [Nitratiruptor sp. YY08-13]BCD65585.1 flavodoxin I [Nitratiruptor sp. YY08-26]